MKDTDNDHVPVRHPKIGAVAPEPMHPQPWSEAVSRDANDTKPRNTLDVCHQLLDKTCRDLRTVFSDVLIYRV